MVEVLDPPLPPELPPFLRRGGGRSGKWILAPSMMHVTACQLLRDPTNNWQTVIFPWMARWNTESEEMLFAHSASRRYRSWLELHEGEWEVPPHVAFGGVLEMRQPDPTLHDRWISWAQEYFY